MTSDFEYVLLADKQVSVKRGDIFASGAQCLVVPVNTIGVAGKGLALQFRKRFPSWYASYQERCRQRIYDAGDFLAIPVKNGAVMVGEFYTKTHWRDPSYLRHISTGLIDLAHEYRSLGMGSIAVPPVGCGLGGLDWDEVKPLVVSCLLSLR